MIKDLEEQHLQALQLLKVARDKKMQSIENKIELIILANRETIQALIRKIEGQMD